VETGSSLVNSASKPNSRGGFLLPRLKPAELPAQQYLRGGGRLYIRVFPHKSITSIPLETRMGKGKGEPDFWAAVIRPGTVLFEIGGVTEDVAKVCFARLAHKMPVRVRMVKKRTM
jgi:large subunit ribosomal protein L16